MKRWRGLRGTACVASDCTERRVYAWLAACLGAMLAMAWSSVALGGGLPLVPDRATTFEIDGGTWMSLDVAPDGQAVLFDLLGDIYTLPIDGGVAQPLLTGQAFYSQPVFSPDGRHFAFISDHEGNENLWVARADGSELHALSHLDDNTEFSSPAWSPDGRGVFVSRIRPESGVFETWRYDADGGGGERLAPAPHELAQEKDDRPNALGVAASPDGRYLYYATRRGFFVTTRPFAPWSIVRQDMVTGDVEVIVTSHGGATRPSLSPDGRTLVYGTRRDGGTALRARDLESGADRELVFPVQIDQQEAWATLDLMPRHAFTPDGEAVLFTHAGKIKRVEVATGHVSELPFTASVELSLGPDLRREIDEDEGPVRARLIHEPSESPDGSRIVFSAMARLYVMDLERGTPRRVTAADRSEFQPSWSPDGRWIVYVSWNAREGGHIWRVSSDGGEPAKLTETPAYYTHPVFTPDGREVFAVRSSHHERMHRAMEYGPFRQAEIVRLPASGGQPVIVTSGAIGGPAQFTHDTQRVFFYAAEGLSSIRLDGTDRRRHLRVTGPSYYFEEQRSPVQVLRISPDGKHALAQIRSQLYLVEVPVAEAEEAVTIDVGVAPFRHRKLTTIGADFTAWAASGRTITWAVGSTYFRRPLDTVNFAAPPETNRSIEAHSRAYPVVVELERDRPAGTLVLRGATVITMREDEVIDDADIVIVDNRIAAVGPRGEVEFPAGAEIRSLSGRYIVPGFIDTHSHCHGGTRRFDSHHRHAHLPGHDRRRPDDRAARIFHRPGSILVQRIRIQGTRAECPDPLPRPLPCTQPEAVSGGQPATTPVGRNGGGRPRPDAYYRGGSQPEAQPDANPRWLRGHRARIAGDGARA
jgi:Tol biopolymer transport system component